MKHSITCDQMTRAEVLQPIKEYDRPRAGGVLLQAWFRPYHHLRSGLGQTPLSAQGNLGLSSGDFEGGKTGAVAVLRKLGFDVEARRRAK
jgi:hypothetical protein